MPFSSDIREICSLLSLLGPGALGHHVNWAGQHACRHVRPRLRYRERDPGLAPAARAIEASVGPLQSESVAEKIQYACKSEKDRGLPRYYWMEPTHGTA